MSSMESLNPATGGAGSSGFPPADIHEDLDGRKIRVEPDVKLRNQRAFPAIHSLTDQLRQDVQQVRDWAATKFPALVAPTDGVPSAAGPVTPKMSYT